MKKEKLSWFQRFYKFSIEICPEINITGYVELSERTDTKLISELIDLVNNLSDPYLSRSSTEMLRQKAFAILSEMSSRL